MKTKKHEEKNDFSSCFFLFSAFRRKNYRFISKSLLEIGQQSPAA